MTKFLAGSIQGAHEAQLLQSAMKRLECARCVALVDAISMRNIYVKLKGL